MGSEYSMNVFICGNLTKEILEKVIYKIFSEKGSNSYSKFQQTDKDLLSKQFLL